MCIHAHFNFLKFCSLFNRFSHMLGNEMSFIFVNQNRNAFRIKVLGYFFKEGFYYCGVIAPTTRP